MKSKKKLIIAISSLVAVIAISLVAIVAIFAAQNQNVRSSLTVTYTAVDVSATVKANYIVGATKTAMLTEDNKEELVFLPTSEEGGTLSPQEEVIELDVHNNTIVFEYIFINDSNSIDVAIDIDTTGFSMENMTLSYAYSYSQITDTSTMPTTESFEPMMILGETKESGAYETLYVYVRASIANLANDASFEGNMDFSLTKATPVKLAFENVADATNNVLLQTRIVPANTNINSLPTPTFASGELYTWFTNNALDELVEYPINISEDLTVYAGVSPYVLTVSESGTMLIENVSEQKLYLPAEEGQIFIFGERNYSISESSTYIIVDAGQSVSLSGDPQSLNVQMSMPSDLETKLFYAAYGAYPQTYVGNSLNSALKNANLTGTGKSYTTDIKGVSKTLQEYSYNGKLYAKLDGGSLYSGSNVAFLNGEKVANGQTYFFYVEPIVARAQEKNSDETYTMMSLDILGSRAYDASSNDWENSEMRTYLNNAFLNESGLTDIAVEQEVQNTLSGNYVDGIAVNTRDKVRIASISEILKWSGSGVVTSDVETALNGSGKNYSDDFNSARKITQSDLACATHANWSAGYGRYYLRSSGYESGYSCRINSGGNIYSAHSCTTTDSGYCPIFAVNV